MDGYNSKFLAEEIKLPEFSMRLDNKVLLIEGEENPLYRQYIHYTVAMHRHHRSPLFSALNIDRKNLKSVKRSGWSIDDRIGFENQLDNAYYRNNRWDRGHLARRAAAAHGKTPAEAKLASDATMFYSNACLQFNSFNQDEWLELEDWVLDSVPSKDGKISVFSGPIYGEDPLWVAPENRKPAEVPAAFFKIVCFMGVDGKLVVRAFNVPQDQTSMADWQGRNLVDLQTYQTTVAEIEHLTGLLFDPKLGEANPLLFSDTEENIEKGTPLKVSTFPENIPVDRSDDLTGVDEERLEIEDDEIDVFIVGALPNPKGKDKGNEWVSILNLQPKRLDLAGWRLSDNSIYDVELSGTVQPGMSKRLQGKALGRLQIGNAGDILTLYNAEGKRVDRVRYAKSEVVENRAILFPRRARNLREEEERRQAS